MQSPHCIEVEPPRHFRLREAGFPAAPATTAADAIRAGADYVVVGSPIWRAAEPLRAVHEITDDIERGLRNSPRRTFEILNPVPCSPSSLRVCLSDSNRTTIARNARADRLND